MKRTFSFLVLMLAFSIVGFSQSARTAKKATLLPNNTQIKDLKTGQVIGVAKGTVPTPVVNGKMKMTRSGANTPANSKKSSGNLPLKQLPKNITPLKRLSKQ